MKNLIITTMLLVFWVGLFSQEFRDLPICQENAQRITDINISHKAGNKAIVKSVNPSDFETFLIDWDSIHHVPGMSVSILKNGEAYWQG